MYKDLEHSCFYGLTSYAILVSSSGNETISYGWTEQGNNMPLQKNTGMYVFPQPSVSTRTDDVSKNSNDAELTGYFCDGHTYNNGL